MSLHKIQRGALEYLTADTLAPVPHAFTTRFGGVSAGQLAALNLGVRRGDAPENVYENYRILGQAVGFAPEDTVFAAHQIHSTIVRRVGREDRGCGLLRPGLPDCDGYVTDEPGVALCAFTADCCPVLLYDPQKHAVAAVHAGWRGTAGGIAAEAVRMLRAEFGTDPRNVRAAIGPCIGPCCFETDGDVPEAMRASLGTKAEPAIRAAGEKFFVDIKAINRTWLLESGLLPAQIDVSDDCTACQTERFWSHRRVGDLRGSMAAVICLPEGAR